MAAEPEQRYPRRFYLHRSADVTGVSGTGVVADGVVWQDGTVTVKWLSERPSEVSWGSMDDVLAIHGHDGLTMPIWRDDENGYPFHGQTRCPYEERRKEFEGNLNFGSLECGVADIEAGRVKPRPDFTDDRS